jgi:glutamate 5-kinase
MVPAAGALARDGREVIMVSSGAIAEGMKRLGWTTRPHELNELQAAAAVGQMGLAQMYETKLREHGLARRRCCSRTPTWPTASAT